MEVGINREATLLQVEIGISRRVTATPVGITEAILMATAEAATIHGTMEEDQVHQADHQVEVGVMAVHHIQVEVGAEAAIHHHHQVAVAGAVEDQHTQEVVVADGVADHHILQAEAEVLFIQAEEVWVAEVDIHQAGAVEVITDKKYLPA